MKCMYYLWNISVLIIFWCYLCQFPFSLQTTFAARWWNQFTLKQGDVAKTLWSHFGHAVWYSQTWIVSYNKYKNTILCVILLLSQIHVELTNTRKDVCRVKNQFETYHRGKVSVWLPCNDQTLKSCCFISRNSSTYHRCTYHQLDIVNVTPILLP